MTSPRKVTPFALVGWSLFGGMPPLPGPIAERGPGPEPAMAQAPEVSILGGVTLPLGTRVLGTSPVVSVEVTRPTTPAVSFGIEVGTLGRGREVSEFTRATGDGRLHFRNEERRAVGHVLLTARRHADRSGGIQTFMAATAGLHLTRETVSFERTWIEGGSSEPDPIPPSGEETSWTPLPGVGIGLGIRPGRSRPGLGVAARVHLHAIMGADEGVLPVLAVMGGVRWSPGG